MLSASLKITWCQIIKPKVMNCEKYHTELIEYLEGTLGDKKEQEVAAHLRECESCREFADFMKSALGIIMEEKRVEPDPFLYARIKSKIEPVVKQGVYSRLRHSFHWVPAVAASLVLAAGIFGGLGLGKAITGAGTETDPVFTELQYLMNDMDQEPIEQFLLGL